MIEAYKKKPSIDMEDFLTLKTTNIKILSIDLLTFANREWFINVL